MVSLKYLEGLEKAQRACQGKREAALTKSLEKLKVSGKPGGSKHLGKDGTPRKASLTPRKDLKKSAESAGSSSSTGLEKPKKEEPWVGVKRRKGKALEKAKPLEKDASLATGLEKPVVVVDWYNTLWVGNQVPAENLASLEKLASSCHVTLLSYVGSSNRAKVVKEDMELHIPDHLGQMLAKEICYKKVGVNGKCYWAYEWGACAIFDDCKAIIKECQQWGLDTYPINTKQEGHDWTGGGYETFAEAVDAYLQKQTTK
jgi:hypothetical protein